MTYELFKQGPAVYVPAILLSLVITVLAYGAFPLIFALARSSAITKKKFRRWCYGVNIVVMLVFTVLNGGAINGAPYALWTWVFSSWGIKILSTQGLMPDGGYLADDPNRVTECRACGYRDRNYFDTCPECGHGAKRYVYLNENPSNEAVKICFCRKCGEKLIENSRFCRKCGTEVIT